MIISHEYKFIIITPPKTASTTLHSWFIRPPFCDWSWDDLTQKKDQHSNIIPKACSDYLIAFSWRDILDRNVSLWKHAITQGEVPEDCSFETFCEVFQKVTDVPFYTRSQESFLPTTGIPRYVFCMHKLQEDILNFPPVRKAIEQGVNLPGVFKKNRTRHNHFSSYYTIELKRTVLTRFPQDNRIPSKYGKGQ